MLRTGAFCTVMSVDGIARVTEPAFPFCVQCRSTCASDCGPVGTPAPIGAELNSSVTVAPAGMSTGLVGFNPTSKLPDAKRSRVVAGSSVTVALLTVGLVTLS